MRVRTRHYARIHAIVEGFVWAIGILAISAVVYGIGYGVRLIIAWLMGL